MSMITKTTITIDKYKLDKLYFTKRELEELRDEIFGLLVESNEQDEVSEPALSLRDVYFSLYDQLPKWIADRAKANWDEDYAKNFHCVPMSLSRSVDTGFSYCRSKEGSEFWYGVFDWLNGLLPHPPFPPDVDKPKTGSENDIPVYLGRDGEFKPLNSKYCVWHCEGKTIGIHYAAPADSDIVKLNYGKRGAR